MIKLKNAKSEILQIKLRTPAVRYDGWVDVQQITPVIPVGKYYGLLLKSIVGTFNGLISMDQSVSQMLMCVSTQSYGRPIDQEIGSDYTGQFFHENYFSHAWTHVREGAYSEGDQGNEMVDLDINTMMPYADLAFMWVTDTLRTGTVLHRKRFDYALPTVQTMHFWAEMAFDYGEITQSEFNELRSRFGLAPTTVAGI